ncbi:glycosyltransferase family 2 protein [Lacticaseibacillus nasuensis]|uniref:glycosyltransferase family 2 protein n=1 Tax=Lacticaseibacillus nasuensis TaxID=944671 RepID=UPI0022468612|nr:glycosyltransferase family 2 protein [Lacticaseibacillus nasuensis]MCX2456192.1 glycosyltransferase family 2 protein [Lacticaseibacillus nasuensis]
MAKTIYIVVPCYDEEEMLPISAPQLLDKLMSLIHSSQITDQSRIMFVNDGSGDQTWSLIQQLHSQDSHYSGVNLSRNRGHQNALLAGLMTAAEYCDAAISIDADLQDDINAIDDMVTKFNDGYDIVYGVRSDRTSDTFFKRFTAQSFYRVMNMLGAKTIFNHADFRLMSRRVLAGLAEFPEVNLFLRGIIPMIGFKSTTTEYARKERIAGESKYPLRKMIGFALEGITSLSTVPLRLITYLGGFIFSISVVFAIYTLVQHALNHTISGWSSLMISLWAIGGLVMFSLGVVGEYIGKIYLETKKRPRYLIESVLNDTEQKKL